MNLSIPKEVFDLMHALEERGFECYIVGGTIRDMLLGNSTHDYDLTTNATPDDMLEVFQNYTTIPTGIKHGTLTVLTKKYPVEITTYRKDSEYIDHRHPSSVTFSSSLEEDCARRDFTINALCYNENSGLKDFFSGQLDLEKRIIRCIGNPEERFEEDALRILRALRFQTQLNFVIEENTKQAIFTKKELLRSISLERIHEELNGILSHPAKDLFTEYKEVFTIFLPEIQTINDFSALDKEGTPLTRMALLLRNTSNPKEILQYMKYSNQDLRSILNYIAYEEFPLDTRINIKKCMSHILEDFQDFILYRSALDSSLDKDLILSTFQEVIDNDECISLSQLDIDGNDLLELGYKGKEISEKLNALLESVLEERIENKKEILKASL